MIHENTMNVVHEVCDNECFYFIVYLLSVTVQLILIDAHMTSVRCLQYHIQ